MGDGLFFWLIIIAVAVLQGIGQKKKKSGQPGQEPPASPRPRPAPPPDQERVTASPRPTTASSGPGRGGGEGGSSEGMIPSDVWAEILGLARGEPQQTEAEVPPPAEVPIPVSREERQRGTRPREDRPAAAVAGRKGPLAAAGRPFPTSHGADAALHETKTGDFESRLAVSRTPRSESKSGKGRGVRARLFGIGSPRELRKAIILKEVLSAPVGLREEGE